jgi:hypothetical protein
VKGRNSLKISGSDSYRETLPHLARQGSGKYGTLRDLSSGDRRVIQMPDRARCVRCSRPRLQERLCILEIKDVAATRSRR